MKKDSFITCPICNVALLRSYLGINGHFRGHIKAKEATHSQKNDFLNLVYLYRQGMINKNLVKIENK